MNIYEKISAVRVALLKSGIAKEKSGAKNYYKYIDLPQIEGIITEECAKVGLLTIVDFPDGHASITAIDLENPMPKMELGYGTQPSSVTITVPCDSSMVDIQGSQPIQKVGGMMTYMRRYLYMTLFAISEHDAVEGIGKLSQETANDMEEIEKSKEETPSDPKRKEIIEKFNKDLPNYLEQLVAYKHAKSLDDFTTEFLEEIYKKKNPKKAEEKANG